MKEIELYEKFNQFGNFLLKNTYNVLSKIEIEQLSLAFTEFEGKETRSTFSGRYIAVANDMIVIFDVNQEEIIKTKVDKSKGIIKVSKTFDREISPGDLDIGYGVKELSLTFVTGEEVKFSRPSDNDMAKIFDEFAALY